MTELTNPITGALFAHLPLQLPQQAGKMRPQEERMLSQAQRGREAVRLVPAEVPQEVPLGQQPQRRLRERGEERMKRCK